MKKFGGKLIIAIVLLVIAVGGGVFFLGRGPGESAPSDETAEPTQTRTGKAIRQSSTRHGVVSTEDEGTGRKTEASEKDDDEEATDDPEGGESPSESADELEEKLVDAFDALTDKWQEPAADKVTMNEVKKFCEQFAKVPKARQEECVQRALNLVPDENVMLLAGILFDKTQDPEILELVYNDILNRDEDVKKPILREVFKDKEHPCWADTAWILDVTGELPNKKGEDDK